MQTQIPAYLHTYIIHRYINAHIHDIHFRNDLAPLPHLPRVLRMAEARLRAVVEIARAEGGEEGKDAAASAAAAADTATVALRY